MEKPRSLKRICFLAVCFCLILASAVTAVSMVGCGSSETSEEKIRDLEFTVATPAEIPAELQKIIDQKKKEAFRLTYTSGQELYIASGYGEQKTGGYSISVPELYLTDNSITIKTELIGPGKEEQGAAEPSWPYIVVSTEFIDRPVVFK